VHYVLADNGSIIIPANSSFGTTKIETKNVANADVTLVLVLEGNETIKPNVNSGLYFCLMSKINTGFIGVKLVRN
jgi:hypothetical protein